MKEQHPIDELFARVLRNAEAEPPARVWQGIAHGRKRAGWLRRWGWLPLLLLCTTGIGYGLMDQRTSTSAESAPALSLASPNAPLGEATSQTIMQEEAEPANNLARSAPAAVEHQGEHTANAALGQQSGPAMPASGQAALEQRATTAVPPHGASGTTEANPARTATDMAVAIEAEGSAQHAHVGDASLAAGITGSGLAVARSSNVAETTRGLGRAYRLSTQLPPVGSEPVAADLLHAGPLSFAAPHRSWWIAATAGQFRENRTWKGGDDELRTALQGTELPHATTAFGMVIGVHGRGGWSLATGIEHHAGRYNFKHADRFRTRRDSIVTYVVTFNSLILATSTDTISTFSEEQRSVAAVNRYSTLRIPVEIAWHAPYRRFRLGVRAGLALELSTLRSGATLMHNGQGLQSVEVDPVDKQRMSVLAGGLGADFGYVLTEHWSLWASPVYEAALLSLSPAGHLPYALPERMGLRFRLAYTIRP